MLIKEICKLCIFRKFSKGWTEDDNSSWRNGYVQCPAIECGSDMIKTNEKAPEGCPYSLEHILGDQNPC